MKHTVFVLSTAVAALASAQPATTQQELFKLLPSDGAADDLFGSSVSLDGGVALVGAPWDDDNGSFSGSA